MIRSLSLSLSVFLPNIHSLCERSHQLKQRGRRLWFGFENYLPIPGICWFVESPTGIHRPLLCTSIRYWGEVHPNYCNPCSTQSSGAAQLKTGSSDLWRWQRAQRWEQLWMKGAALWPGQVPAFIGKIAAFPWMTESTQWYLKPSTNIFSVKRNWVASFFGI